MDGKKISRWSSIAYIFEANLKKFPMIFLSWILAFFHSPGLAVICRKMKRKILGMENIIERGISKILTLVKLEFATKISGNNIEALANLKSLKLP